MNLTSPEDYLRLQTSKWKGYEVATLPAGSTMYRGDERGSKTPSKDIPAFFSDRTSVQLYSGDTDPSDTVSSYTTANPARLFVLGEANFRRLMEDTGEKGTAFLKKNYLHPMTLDNASRDALRAQMTLNPTPIGNKVTVINAAADEVRLPNGYYDYANRRLARWVCAKKPDLFNKVDGFDGWIAFPHTILEGIPAADGHMAVHQYMPEVMLCKWSEVAQRMSGGRRKTRRRRPKTRRNR